MKTRKQAGVSLIEIMVTVMVVGILASIAAPNLQSLIEKNRIRSVTDELLSSLYRARSEAVKRGYDVVLCASSADQSGCDSTATDYSNGWLMFTDYDRDRGLTAPGILFDVNGNGTQDTPEEILFVSNNFSGRHVIASTKTALQRRIIFGPTGTPNVGVGASFQVSEDGTNETQQARVTLGMTGRVRSCVGDYTECN